MFGLTAGGWLAAGLLLAGWLGIAGCLAPAEVAPPTPPAGEALKWRVWYSARPAGEGPFPGMLVLHGCSGVGGHTREWADRLASWGYLAVVVDSLGPRGLKSICGRKDLLPGERAADVREALAAVREMPGVDSARMGMIGFSHGGSTVLKAVQSPPGEWGPGGAPRAAVSFYPWCETRGTPRVRVPLLVMIGEADDWTPAERCRRMAPAVDLGLGYEVVTYPGALHGFDFDRPPRLHVGHQLAYEPRSAEDAIARTRVFLFQRLMK